MAKTTHLLHFDWKRDLILTCPVNRPIPPLGDVPSDTEAMAFAGELIENKHG